VIKFKTLPYTEAALAEIVGVGFWHDNESDKRGRGFKTVAGAKRSVNAFWDDGEDYTAYIIGPNPVGRYEVKVI